jgi:hypothetical protein
MRIPGTHSWDQGVKDPILNHHGLRPKSSPGPTHPPRSAVAASGAVPSNWSPTSQTSNPIYDAILLQVAPDQ